MSFRVKDRLVAILPRLPYSCFPRRKPSVDDADRRRREART